MTVTLRFKRFMMPGTLQCRSVKEAVAIAGFDVQNETAYPVDVIDAETGEVILDPKELGAVLRVAQSAQSSAAAYVYARPR